MINPLGWASPQPTPPTRFQRLMRALRALLDTSPPDPVLMVVGRGITPIPASRSAPGAGAVPLLTDLIEPSAGGPGETVPVGTVPMGTIG